VTKLILYVFLVGTGASCVYALLGAKLNSWKFIATDADATNVDYATANVDRNNLADKIKGLLMTMNRPDFYPVYFHVGSCTKNKK